MQPLTLHANGPTWLSLLPLPALCPFPFDSVSPESSSYESMDMAGKAREGNSETKYLACFFFCKGRCVWNITGLNNWRIPQLQNRVWFLFLQNERQTTTRKYVTAWSIRGLNLAGWVVASSSKGDSGEKFLCWGNQLSQVRCWERQPWAFRGSAYLWHHHHRFRTIKSKKIKDLILPLFIAFLSLFLHACPRFWPLWLFFCLKNFFQRFMWWIPLVFNCLLKPLFLLHI